MELTECAECPFHRGETGGAVICACLGGTALRHIFPSAFGVLEVLPCPLEILKNRYPVT
jgi:hypothetical protein